MSVQVAPPSVARGVGAKHTQRYEALKRELEEFCAKGPQVRILECAAARRRNPPGAGARRRRALARSSSRVRGSARAFQRRATGFPSPARERSRLISVAAVSTRSRLPRTTRSKLTSGKAAKLIRTFRADRL